MIIYQIANNKHKLKTFLVNAKTLKLVYLKGQYLAYFYSTSLFLTCFYFLIILTLEVIQTRTPPKLSTKIPASCIPLLSWFKGNKLKQILDKCYSIVSGTENVKTKLDDFTITNSKKENLLGIIFDDTLYFQYHNEILCKKVDSKISALSRITPFFNPPEKKNLIQLLFSVTV